MEEAIVRDALIRDVLIKFPITTKALGEYLYVKIKEIDGMVIPEWTEALNQLRLQNCIDYIVNSTYNGVISEKSIIEDDLAELLSQIHFEESNQVLDDACDIDYVGWVGTKAFGIQIKHSANFSNYSPSDRMQANFNEFEEKYGGKIFVVFSTKVNGKKVIQNKELIPEIEAEIKRLKEE